MLRYFSDHNFHADIVRGLRKRRVDCLTAHEDGRRRVGDLGILSRASELRRILITHDDDFLTIAATARSTGTQFTGIIYAHPWRVRVGECIDDLDRTLALA